MENIILSPKEFLFLCAGMGASEVYGIIDGYKDVNQADPDGELRLIQQSLEIKGYIESDFDGNSSVRSDVVEHVVVCAACQKLITFDSQTKYTGQGNVVYYVSDDKIVKSVRKDGDYHLSYINVEDISADIKNAIQLEKTDVAKSFDKVHMPQRDLEKIKKLVSSDNKAAAKREMQKYFDPAVSDIVLSAIEKQENFYSLTAADFTLSDDSVRSIMLINSSAMNIKMQPIVVDLRTEIEFEAINEEAVSNAVDALLELVFPEKTGDEANG